MFMMYLYIFIGGGLGSLLRYACSISLQEKIFFPWLMGIPLGTLVVNWLGAFILGFISGSLLFETNLRIGISTGLMGGFTTFSTFSVEEAKLLAVGQGWKVLLHALLHVGGGLILAIVGLSLGAFYAKKV